jgi:pimeloyl-ACP methyl ester carboxylesterase
MGLELGGATDTVFGTLGWQGGDRRVLAQSLYEVMTVDLRRRLPDITAPVTVVYGWSADGRSPRSRTDTLFRSAYSRLRAPAAFVPIEGAEHMVMIDQPGRFLAAVDRFLA